MASVDIEELAQTAGTEPVEVYAVLRALVDNGWFSWRYVAGTDAFADAQDEFISRRREMLNAETETDEVTH